MKLNFPGSEVRAEIIKDRIAWNKPKRVPGLVDESGSFRPLSRSPLSRFAHFHVRPESFRPRVVSPTFRSPLSRFAHFPVRPRVVLPPYKILFLVLLFRPQSGIKLWFSCLLEIFRYNV